jgi:hypothetical protein
MGWGVISTAELGLKIPHLSYLHTQVKIKPATQPLSVFN